MPEPKVSILIINNVKDQLSRLTTIDSVSYEGCTYHIDFRMHEMIVESARTCVQVAMNDFADGNILSEELEEINDNYTQEMANYPLVDTHNHLCGTYSSITRQYTILFKLFYVASNGILHNYYIHMASNKIYTQDGNHVGYCTYSDTNFPTYNFFDDSDNSDDSDSDSDDSDSDSDDDLSDDLDEILD